MYYYFSASLPLLDFGMDPPQSMERFLGDCERLLSAQDFGYIQEAFFDTEEGPFAGNALLKQWKEFIQSFQNEIAVYHTGQQKKDPASYIRGERRAESLITEALSQAAKSSNPLEAEKILDYARWQRLNELEQQHYFDINYLIIYTIKLKILNRYQKIASMKGKEVFEDYREQAIENCR